jgi:hypothetical protein
MRMEDLEAQIRRLEDCAEIRNSIAKYGFLIDDLQPATVDDQLLEFLDLFTDDLLDEHNDEGGPGTKFVFHGKAEFAKYLREGVASNRALFSIHQNFNPYIEVDGDRATAQYYLLAPGMQGPPGERRAFWSHGSYKNEYQRVNGKWLIARKVYTRSFLTPYEIGWHKVGFTRDLGERGRRSVLPPEHAKLIRESDVPVQAGPGELWRDPG